MKTNPPKYYLGIDAGGTRSRALLVGRDGTVHGFGLGGAANPSNTGMDCVVRGLGAAAEAAWKDAGIPRARRATAACFIGAAGIKEKNECAAYGRAAALAGLAPADKCVAANDTEAALAGGLPGKPGMVLIAGTGSFCVGRDASGRVARCGGWGWLMCDAGSGFYLGHEALRVAARAGDGRLAPGLLSASVLKHFGVRDPELLMTSVYSGAFSPAPIASLAPLVMSAALAGDRAAEKILRAGARDLAELAARVSSALSWRRAVPEMILVGGAAKSGKPYQPLIEAAIRKAVPGVVISNAALPPVAGAALRALELDNITINPALLERLASGLAGRNIL